MSKSLHSFSESQRTAVALRRVGKKSGKGLGYLAARDYLKKVGIEVKDEAPTSPAAG